MTYFAAVAGGRIAKLPEIFLMAMSVAGVAIGLGFAGEHGWGMV